MTHKATTLSDFEAIIKKISCNRTQTWFRGHSSGHHLLEPSSFRRKKEILAINDTMRDFKLTKGDYIMPNEWAYREEFKSLYEQSHRGVKLSNFESLYMMQHYGIYTRLLDFSMNPMVALYFALSKRPLRIVPQQIAGTRPMMDDDLEEYDAAVYCIDPIEVNQWMHGLDHIPEIDDNWMGKLERAHHPIAIKTSLHDKRILAQQGVFLLFGSMVRHLEWYDWKNPHIHKITIPNEHILSLYQELRHAGITHFSIYPDFEGKVKDLNEQMMDNLSKNYTKMREGTTEDRSY